MVFPWTSGETDDAPLPFVPLPCFLHFALLLSVHSCALRLLFLPVCIMTEFFLPGSIRSSIALPDSKSSPKPCFIWVSSCAPLIMWTCPETAQFSRKETATVSLPGCFSVNTINSALQEKAEGKWIMFSSCVSPLGSVAQPVCFTQGLGCPRSVGTSGLPPCLWDIRGRSGHLLQRRHFCRA